jgi:hypothetical protein
VTYVLVVRERGKGGFLVMTCIVVAKNEPHRGIHVLINIHQAIYICFNVDVFTPLKNRVINEMNSASDDPFVGTPFLIGDV